MRNDSLWDNLLFRWVVKNAAGLQRARLMFVGSAPLNGDILTFMRATVGCVVSTIVVKSVINHNAYFTINYKTFAGFITRCEYVIHANTCLLCFR